MTMRNSGWSGGRGVTFHGWVLTALCLGACSSSGPAESKPVSQTEEPIVEETVRGAYESVDDWQDPYVDERGLRVEGIGVDHPARLYPASADFPSGPDVGERLPEFTLSNQHGDAVDFHADRGGQKAVVVFYRSAVW